MKTEIDTKELERLREVEKMLVNLVETSAAISFEKRKQTRTPGACVAVNTDPKWTNFRIDIQRAKKVLEWN